jgi:Xaa-Pro dipeptidase
MSNYQQIPSAHEFARAALPSRFCNLDRLLHAMKVRSLDGIVATTPWNVFYLTGFNGVAHKSDEPRPYALILSRHAPEHPILVLADYYLATFLMQPTWVEDIRPFRAVMMPLDLPPKRTDIDRFIPQHGTAVHWIAGARKAYAFDMTSAVRGALKDLKLDQGRVAFDDMGFGFRLEIERMQVADGYDALMFARAVKTETEMRLLERATALNEAAIGRTIAAWDKGATWRDLNRAYARAVTELGGFVRDPGAMVWGHPRGADPALTLATGLENDTVEPGTHVMFDCHGTIDLYCWDGGKTWVVEGAPEGGAKRFADATARVAEMLLSAMRPGARISELQAKGREIYRREGVPDPNAAVIFFHGP